MTRRAVVSGVGHYLPKRVVENSHFESFLDTSDEWIKSRSGIERRHFAEDGETTSSMGAAAARAALAMAGLLVVRPSSAGTIAVVMAGTTAGGVPKYIGSNLTLSKKAPRLA